MPYEPSLLGAGVVFNILICQLVLQGIIHENLKPLKFRNSLKGLLGEILKKLPGSSRRVPALYLGAHSNLKSPIGNR